MMDPDALYRSYGRTPPRTAAQRGMKPKFVKFAPGDRGDFLPDIFFEDPRTYKPKPGPLGQIHAWGLFPYEYPPELSGDPLPIDATNNAAYDGFQSLIRKMQTQNMYAFGRYPMPENQFMKVIVERKRNQLKDYNFNGLDKCDVICKIFLTGMPDSEGNPRIWRRFKVSAGISLQALQDKVVAPLMGWVRNLHCYTFTDFRDGALFGPEHSSSIDIGHIAQVGYEYLPDNRYKFAHLFGKEGDSVGYLYDFGDKWYHQINIEKIVPPEQSTGAVNVLEGRGMCPGENMKGCLHYIDFLDDYEKGSASKRAKLARDVLAAPNYKLFGAPVNQFDPSKFDIGATKARVSEALNSTSSVRSGAKQFTVPYVPQDPAKFDRPWMKDISLVVQHDDNADSGGYWNEVRSDTKDKLRVACCAACGKPASRGVDLKTCSGCRKVMYCSIAHQKDHWKERHKKQCTREFLESKSSQESSTSRSTTIVPEPQDSVAAVAEEMARRFKLDEMD
ncbi:MM3350-like domain-containing protein [Panaeolus papilionaceus]|nr:MM3350-like domain-containing protein [Panaeolus papilionaceus]